jgi:hypothetical protein
MITRVNIDRHAAGYTHATIGLIAVDGPLARL